jgi:hypothetical protein
MGYDGLETWPKTGLLSLRIFNLDLTLRKYELFAEKREGWTWQIIWSLAMA